MFTLDFKWVYELIILFYTVAIIGYFFDFIQQNRKVNRLAFLSLSMVWLMQTVFLFASIVSFASFPIGTIYDGLYFYAWILITFSLIINRVFRVDFFVFFTNVVGFFIMVLHIFSTVENTSKINTIHFVNEMLITHITLALASYGFFTFSFIFSIMYIIQYRLLKRKKWTKRLSRFGNLGQLDKLSFIAMLLGLPILLIAIILGIIWGYTSDEVFYWHDIKTIGSLLVLIVYAIHLFLRVMRNWQGRKMALLNVYSFLFLLVNYFLFSNLSNFHF